MPCLFGEESAYGRALFGGAGEPEDLPGSNTALGKCVCLCDTEIFELSLSRAFNPEYSLCR